MTAFTDTRYTAAAAAVVWAIVSAYYASAGDSLMAIVGLLASVAFAAMWARDDLKGATD